MRQVVLEPLPGERQTAVAAPTGVHWNWRPGLRWFGAEFLVIVTGVLVALGLNAFYQQRQDASSEQVYLSLLDRDLRHTIADLTEETGFETAQLRDGLTAYRALSAGEGAATAPASAALQRLTVRRTLSLQDATYRDLISTGNLRLIRDRRLRDRIVDYYEATLRQYEVLNRNNSYFVDNLFNGAVVAAGLILPRSTLDNVPALVPVDSALQDALRAGYVAEPDRLWSLPRNGPEWASLRSVLLSRIRTSSIARYYAGNVLANTRELQTAVQAERKQS